MIPYLILRVTAFDFASELIPVNIEHWFLRAGISSNREATPTGVQSGDLASMYFRGWSLENGQNLGGVCSESREGDATPTAF